MRARSRMLPALALLAGLSALVTPRIAVAQADVPEFIRGLAKDPNDPRLRAWKEQRKRELALQKELRKLRAMHLGSKNHAPTREAGLEKLSAYREPWMFASLLEVFAEERADVRDTVIRTLRESKSDAGDRALMWWAIMHPEEKGRQAAMESLASRMQENDGRATGGMLSVAGLAIASGSGRAMDNAAIAGGQLGIVELLPLLVQAQGGTPGGGGAGGGGRRRGPLGYIAIANQQAYVSDLEPQVATGAVAFDPTIDYLTTGTLLVINDAVVTWSPRFVNAAATKLASDLTGRDLSALGTDQRAWQAWLEAEGKPALAKRQAEFAAKAAARAEQAPTPQPTPKADPEPKPAESPKEPQPGPSER